MTKSSHSGGTTTFFVSRKLPWILAVLAFGLFLATLNRGVTFGNLYPVAEISGWLQGGHYLNPLAYLLSIPAGLFPHNLRGLALNLESALCGALTVYLLARSVVLLPQDRTPEQRNLEHSEHSTFSGRFCWLPPIVAVLVLALERTYWESSTEASGRMFDLLGFAFCIRCLLEYRLDREEKWFSMFAFVYGLLMANDWLMVAFFPFFIASVVWIKGLSAFETVFVKRVLLWGFLGLCLIFLQPLMNQFNPYSEASFWTTLKATFIADKRIIYGFFITQKITALLLSLTSIIPIIVVSFRWGSSFGDNSPFGVFLAGMMFHLVNGLFFLAGMWVALDAQINPRVQIPGAGEMFLPLNFLGALAIGYFTGYFLLLFGSGIFKHDEMNPLKSVIDWVVTVVVLALVILTPALMLARNIPYIQKKSRIQQAMTAYIGRLEQLLPKEGAVVMSDDPVRLMYLRSNLSARNEDSKFLFVDTSSLLHRTNYARLLKMQNPSFPIADKWLTNSTSLIYAVNENKFLDEVSQKYPLYYLHSSFGHFFEKFLPEQHGMVFKLGNFPENVWDAPPADEAQISFNKGFFDDLSKSDDLAFIQANMRADDHPKAKTMVEKISKILRLKPELGIYSSTMTGVYSLVPLLGSYYSKSLNEWGVALQRADKFAEARACFQMSTNINPANGSARLNLLANNILSQGRKMALGNPKEVQAVLGVHFGYGEALYVHGVVDEPTFLSDLGIQFAEGGNFRQSVQSFHRALQITEDTLPLELKLAQIQIVVQSSPNQLAQFYPYTNCYQEALTNLAHVLAAYPTNPVALFEKSVALIQLKDYDSAIQALDKFVEVEPENPRGRLNRAIALVQSGKLDEAKVDYNKVVAAVPGSYPAYFGLGEIYYREKNRESALRNYQLYLTNAPPSTIEAAFVRKRVEELSPGAH